ncbi:MAG: FAD-dependent oxidoreductase [Chloroflexi bacterium]|nr:FAD-dependent oxidoreductase [Chloroflexota bacterium]
MRLENLFSPVKLGKMELRNRVVMSAVTTRYDYEDSDRQAEFYAARARGGVGLITLGAYQTIWPGRKTVGHTGIYKDAFIPRLSEWVKTIHAHGAKAAAQLATYTYISTKGEGHTPEFVAPSDWVQPREGSHPSILLAEFLPRHRALAVDEIKWVDEQISDAAVRARTAGFDAVEFQVVGGNLILLFTNPAVNRRTDRYGGSLENRLRIFTETVALIKKKAGSDYPIIVRIPGDDLLSWGQGLAGWQQMAAVMEKAGVHAFNIYPVWHEGRMPVNQMSVPRGAFVPLAEGIRQVVSIPVIAGVRINDPVLADSIIAQGKADLVSMTRPLIADEEILVKAREGRLEDIRMCTACCRCFDDVNEGRPMSCSVNARAGKETKYTAAPAARPGKVLVIGGGPAGMEAARVAAGRGHKVTLYEKGRELGGQLLYAVVPPYKDEWRTTITYLAGQLEKLGVTVRLGERCTPAVVEKEKPDAVIIAAGAEPCLPGIPGIDGANVFTAVDVLAGRGKPGANVVIIGGGSVGCETAEFLVRQGKKATILEMLPKIGADYGPINRWVVMDRLAAAGIRVETRARAQEITGRGVRIQRLNSNDEFFEADSVVLAVGAVPVDDLASQIEGKAPRIIRTGDCLKPGTVKDAIESGFLAGSGL